MTSQSYSNFTELLALCSAVHCDVIIKIFWRKFRIVDETWKSSAKYEFFKLTLCVYHFSFGNYRLSKLCFSIVFILWLALFANQHTKSIEKRKLLKLIAPKQVKIDIPWISLLFQMSVSIFLIKTKTYPFSGLFTNSKQRYTKFDNDCDVILCAKCNRT